MKETKHIYKLFVAILLVLSVCNTVGIAEQLPTDAILQDGTDSITFIAYKPLEGVVEKNPSNQLYVYDVVKSLVYVVSSSYSGTIGNSYSDSATYIIHPTWLAYIILGMFFVGIIITRRTSTRYTSKGRRNTK